ncbi:MAG: hypothetical protein HOP29_14700 [Phycisphaerales bacterium]|nr:hypothetical protein [Phycisphaerales bacterium]
MRSYRWTCSGVLFLLAFMSGESPSRGQSVRVEMGTPVAEIRIEARALREFVKSSSAKQFLEAAGQLPPIKPRTLHIDRKNKLYYRADEFAALTEEQRAGLEEKSYDEAFYYLGRYGTPTAYCRAIDLAAEAGLTDLAGKHILDFGYGMIGQLRMLAILGADVTGVDVDPLLPVLYGFPGDQGDIAGTGSHPGRIKLVHGRYPAEAATVEAVGGGYDLVISKNVLKRGYIHPAREADERMLIKLGVDDATFAKAVYAALNPGGMFLIYNLCPKQAPPDKPYLPYSDGECPFAREVLESTGFKVVAFDTDDTTAARKMATLIGWQDDGMDIENDLFAHYTLCRK